MSFLQNREVYFNQESLPITLPQFPLQKSCQTQRISTHKLQCQFFNIVRDKMHLSDISETKRTKLSGRKLRPDLFTPLMTKNNKHSPYNLHG